MYSPWGRGDQCALARKLLHKIAEYMAASPAFRAKDMFYSVRNAVTTMGDLGVVGCAAVFLWIVGRQIKQKRNGQSCNSHRL